MKLNTAQRIRLNKVLDYLKEQGVTQKSFAKDYFEDDETRISELKSGKRTTIPDGFLDMLQAQYHINADYIRGNSKMMLDVCGTKLENFDKVFESWETVEKRKRIEKDGLNAVLQYRFSQKWFDILAWYSLTSTSCCNNCYTLHVFYPPA